MPDPDHEFTPENIRSEADQVKSLRARFLCELDDAGADPEAEQFYLLALGALDSATRYLELSSLKQSQALARARGVR